MDRFLLVLGAVAILQSLLARRKRPGGTGGLPEGVAGSAGDGLPPSAGEEAERAGPDGAGGGAADRRWPQPGARAEAGEPSSSPAGATVARRGGARGRGRDPVATGPRSRTKRPGAVRADAAGGRGRGVLAELFAELEAQAKKELPFPGPRADASPGPRGGMRPGGLETASAGEAEGGLPSFGLPERAESGWREEAAGGRRGEADGPPVRSRTPARGDPWALGSEASARGAGPPAPPARGSSRRPPEVGGDAAATGAPPVEPRPARTSAAQADDDRDRYGLRSRDSLKRAVVAREVLGPPLALRRGREGASWQ